MAQPFSAYKKTFNKRYYFV